MIADDRGLRIADRKSSAIACDHMEEVARYECVYHRTVKISKTKTKTLTAGKKSGRISFIGGGGQIPQHKNCVWSSSEAIENTTFWIGARCSAKRILKSGMAQSTYCTQIIKHKPEIKISSSMPAMLF